MWLCQFNSCYSQQNYFSLAFHWMKREGHLWFFSVNMTCFILKTTWKTARQFKARHKTIPLIISRECKANNNPMFRCKEKHIDIYIYILWLFVILTLTSEVEGAGSISHYSRPYAHLCVDFKCELGFLTFLLCRPEKEKSFPRWNDDGYRWRERRYTSVSSLKTRRLINWQWQPPRSIDMLAALGRHSRYLSTNAISFSPGDLSVSILHLPEKRSYMIYVLVLPRHPAINVFPLWRVCPCAFPRGSFDSCSRKSWLARFFPMRPQLVNKCRYRFDFSVHVCSPPIDTTVETRNNYESNFCVHYFPGQLHVSTLWNRCPWIPFDN